MKSGLKFGLLVELNQTAMNMYLISTEKPGLVWQFQFIEPQGNHKIVSFCVLFVSRKNILMGIVLIVFYKMDGSK